MSLHHNKQLETTFRQLCDLPLHITFNRNYASILYRFQDTASYLWKFANFDLPYLHLALPLGVTPFEFRKYYCHQKTRVSVLSCGVISVFLCLAILVEHRLVTDRHRQTDTDRHTTMAYTAKSIARAVKTEKLNSTSNTNAE